MNEHDPHELMRRMSRVAVRVALNAAVLLVILFASATTFDSTEVVSVHVFALCNLAIEVGLAVWWIKRCARNPY